MYSARYGESCQYMARYIKNRVVLESVSTATATAVTAGTNVASIDAILSEPC